jgi:hypothetical protein
MAICAAVTTASAQGLVADKGTANDSHFTACEGSNGSKCSSTVTTISAQSTVPAISSHGMIVNERTVRDVKRRNRGRSQDAESGINDCTSRGRSTIAAILSIGNGEFAVGSNGSVIKKVAGENACSAAAGAGYRSSEIPRWSVWSYSQQGSNFVVGECRTTDGERRARVVYDGTTCTECDCKGSVIRKNTVRNRHRAAENIGNSGASPESGAVGSIAGHVHIMQRELTAPIQNTAT